MNILLIDDLRSVEYILKNYGVSPTHVARSYNEGIELLKTIKFDSIYLDHDLASYDASGKELTGYDVMVFLEQNKEYRPSKYVFVTSNPVGRDNMKRVLDSFYLN